MRILNKLTIAALALAALGCASKPQKPKEVDPMANSREADALFVNSISDTAVNNGIIAQHTLYPYHFVSGTAKLNELGVRELAVLSDHYKTAVGPINVRKGDAGTELYQARVSTVAGALAAAGVKAENVTIKDGRAGGSGMSSESLNAGVKALSSDRYQADSSAGASDLSSSAAPVTTGQN
jgi:hypothetical protein